jgi:hypothetical protein
MGRHGWTMANAIMALMFAASVIVQINDPDPIAWMLVYGGAALISGLEVARRARPIPAAAVGLAALMWAATIPQRVVGTVPFADMFGGFEMKNQGIEESREMYGLLLIAIWMAAVAVAAGRKKRR